MAEFKIQQHMWSSKGVSHGVLAKSQTGCKTRSATCVSILQNALLSDSIYKFAEQASLQATEQS